MSATLIIAIIICILGVAFFAGIEIAFISANKLNVELKKKQGHNSGAVISRFLEHPEDFIGTSLVGINIFLILYEHFMTELTSPWLEKVLPGKDLLHLLIDTLIGTVVILVLGEFLPKAFFKTKAEKILYFFRVPITFFYKLLFPIASLFVNISEWILKYIFNVKIQEHKSVYSRIDLENFVKQMNTGHKDDEDEEEVNTELLKNALELNDVRVRECLVPRNEIVAVAQTSSVQEVRALLIDTKLSKVLVYDGTIDNIVGYLHHLDFHRKPKDITSILHKIITIPETMFVVELMREFTKERKSIAWVIDEHGGTAGIVTIEDILEEIFGDINDEHDEEEFVEKQIAENEFILSGRLELDYLNKKYELGFDVEEADTLSGFIIANHEDIPKQKDKIVIANYEFDILSVGDTKIEMVKLRWLKD
jgi:putative hemolysin